ncbi:MAG TPA: dihydroorotase [Kiritimatiellia bacterium]|nr:dihydroorotase [Kiritimatiellia bacterium]HMO98280.1 dihydroorotase [Kiritimatiellia bacterium]HMP96277.1 dihydroorotase [Kiritimatiellia bacterium]
MSPPWIIHSPLDMHLHLRQDEMLRAIAPASSRGFAGAVIMPNLVPPVDNLEALFAYREAIQRAIGQDVFTPYMTLFFRNYTAAELERAKPHIIGIKLYPEGVTTNSEDGVRDLREAHAVFDAMEQLEIPLLVHGETHGFVMDREREFTKIYDDLARRYPNLTIIMEHITTVEAVKLLDRHPRLHATVTLHHLLLTLDDMAGGLLNPHLFCKPLLKTPADRDALQEAVLAGHPKIMFGSDSAPHPRHKKECCGCAAGVFSAPVALSRLGGFFHSQGLSRLMQGFVSDHAQAIYGITPPVKRVELRPEPWRVPDEVGGVIPFLAGTHLPWRDVVVD